MSMEGFISLDTFKSVYASNPTYIFDTNIYLDLLRCSKEASKNLLLNYAEFKNDIWAPIQVKHEFMKNISIVEQKRVSNAKNSITEMKKAINLCNNAINKQMNFFVKYKFNQTGEIISRVASELESLKKEIEVYGETYIKDKTTGFIDKQDIVDFFNSISVEEQQEISQSNLFNIYRDGDIRYKYKIPPGYMDDPKNNQESNKVGIDIFGDLVLWNEILEYGKKTNKPIIFVTSDIKEDWFELKNNRPVAPREELLKEYMELTGGKQICIITSEKFVDYMGEILHKDNVRALAEMQKDDFVEIAVRDNEDIIKLKLIEWINKEEHISLIPFALEVNKVINIDKLKIITQDVTVDVREDAYYNVLLQGAAEFEYGYYDQNIKRIILNCKREEFIFNVNISFKRKIEKGNNSGRIFSNTIYDIIVNSGVFEKCNLSNVSLQSQRGTFIQPSKYDSEIYNYMRKNWSKYDKKNSIDRAEALMYIDAAKYFGSSLLEVYRSFSLVQNQECGMNLSLNEIDTLALRRFKNIGFVIKNNICTFDNKEVVLGIAYESPKTNEMLSPESGKEIDVRFKYEVKLIENKYIKIEGVTNLPKYTELVININNKIINYRASSSGKVSEDGKFESEIFTKGSDLELNSMPQGCYELEIVVPIVSIQPDEVKIQFGKNGRNLTGQYVSYDEIMGKTVFFSDIFTI
ncbi:PIN-like domain-containing protein [Clostridium saccharoperbutylacetonicum]|uniref:PIN-like domain-containing protein n=1 Tax=Clostridium saccharoperbutylacetonicum TaxID=36745 RepID=UPI000983D79A|nr:PIN-like domain-containing protein [Clostridium saccharoperbutylacetonicum]AQR96118.1 hypothetical protein CLSAP_34370 [Clostridium saccharoperbutylacetonicum]NSB31987.1 hypothetical protein [Clostridium saccharoperbutylacetonicum]